MYAYIRVHNTHVCEIEERNVKRTGRKFDSHVERTLETWTAAAVAAVAAAATAGLYGRRVMRGSASAGRGESAVAVVVDGTTGATVGSVVRKSRRRSFRQSTVDGIDQSIGQSASQSVCLSVYLSTFYRASPRTTPSAPG